MNEPKIKRTFVLKSYTKKDLAILFGIPEKTFYRWLRPYKEELELNSGHFLTVKQVEFVIRKFGVPGEIELE